MTSRERFETCSLKLGRLIDFSFARHDNGTYTMRDTHIAWSTWQAAERDMLERCVKVAKNERLTDNTGEPTDLAYNMAISHVVYKLKELLNEKR